MSDDVTIAVISAGSMLLASSGVFSYLLKRHSKNNAATKLIMALAYFKSYEMAIVYVERGYVTKDELEDFEKYIFQPYKELGGNGVLEKIMNDVMNLPLRFSHDSEYYSAIKLDKMQNREDVTPNERWIE